MQLSSHLFNFFFIMQDKQAIKQTMEEEARKCHWLVLWLDCDREGENIAYEVVEVCTGVNSQLNIFRARFSALIDRYWLLWMICLASVAQMSYLSPVVLYTFFLQNCREIHEAVQNLGRPNRLFANAVDARQVISIHFLTDYFFFQLNDHLVLCCFFCYNLNINNKKEETL
jgi:DNA topoisomerase III